MSLGVHGVIAELELIPRQRLLPLHAKDKHGGGIRCEAEKFLGRVQPSANQVADPISSGRRRPQLLRATRPEEVRERQIGSA
jgi:hypothetical protein